MPMGPGARKLALTVHVTASVGWIGAVAAFIVLDVSTVASSDEQTLRAAYVAMDMITWSAIVPLALASLVTGIIMSLGTKWGLFRHYWVVISLLLTVLATVVLLVQTPIISDRAAMAADPATTADEVRGLGNLLLHSVGGTVVLLAITVLNVYKPRGVTRHGWRKQQAERRLE